jgi:hypothetical protein
MDFRREYLVRLPLPVAQLYSRAFNAKDGRARHDNAYYLFEALIKLSAADAAAHGFRNWIGCCCSSRFLRSTGGSQSGAEPSLRVGWPKSRLDCRL